MPIRTPESLLCSHCQHRRAAETCAGCKLQICAPCARTWWTCERPVARAFKLGIWRRLIDVDPTGSLGIVWIKWRASYQLVDLRGLRYLQSPRPVSPGRLCQNGQILVTDTRTVHAIDGGQWMTPGGIVLGDAQRGALSISEDGATARLLCLYDSRTGRVIDIHYQPYGPISYDRQRRYRASCKHGQIDICITEIATGELRTIAVSVRDLLSAVYYDPEHSLLIAGSWGKLFVFSEHNSSFGPSRQVPLPDTDVHWLACCGRRVVALCTRSRSAYLAVVEINESGSPGKVRELAIPDPGLESVRKPVIALSPNGESVAVGLRDRTVALCPVGTASTPIMYLSGHTDSVSLLTFTSDGQLLISADDDSRVIMRPRLDSGYATQIVHLPLGPLAPLADVVADPDDA